MEAYEALARVYDRLITPEERERWMRDIPLRLREAGLRPPMSVLDLACGTGLMALQLARMGFKVTGVDLSEEMLERAAENARARGVFVPFVRQDMRELSLHRPVDAVLCSCDGFNYLTEAADVDAAMAAVHRSLKKGGYFLFDVSTRETLAAMGDQFFGEEEDEVAYIWENRYDEASCCLTMDVTLFIREDAKRDLFRRQREIHVQRGHSAEELTAALDRAGFDVRAVEAAFTRSAPGPGCDRIQITARKR